MSGEITPRFRLVLGETRWIAEFPIVADRQFFDRIIKKKPKSECLSMIDILIDTAVRTAESLVRTAAIYGIFKTNELPGHWFPGADYIGLALVTIGDALEKKVEAFTRTREMTDALLLDGWGSAFVEGAVRAIDELLAAESSLLGGRKGKRRSPGYGRWPLSDQKIIIERLNASRLGIVLSDSFMMIPRKSVSFGVPIHLTPGESPRQH
ncbi:hypothetical protein JW823_05190 [bacterium]|nr:hypothetical protein [candidate division CSSED10-310 bacterium]